MHKLLLLSLFALSGMFIGQQESLAQEIAEQPCDPAVYKQMSSRAWLESEREIMQNQNLIFKADSVLEYVCFDQFLSKAAWEGGDVFTHTTYFGTEIIPRGTDNSLETALERTVYNPFVAHKSANFGHSLLGGRGEFLDPPLGFLDIGTEVYPPTAGQGKVYGCGYMRDVWRTAKCLNFVHNAEFSETDSFYPLKTIEGLGGPSIAGYEDIIDTRQYPVDMACNSEIGVTDWDLANLEAANEKEVMYLFQSPLGEIFLDVEEKTVPGKCTPAIMTGVRVVLQGGPAHQDGVCSNPGCTFTAGGGCS